MKQTISLVLNFVLLIAVAVLYYLHFSASHSQDVNTEKPSKTQQQRANSNNLNLPLVYVNSDTILERFEMVGVIQAELLEEKSRLERRLQTEAEKYQQELERYQGIAASLSPRQRAIEEEAILKRQQEIYQLEETLSIEFAERERKLSEQLKQKLNELFEQPEYRSKYQVILSRGMLGSNILYADSTMNITDMVIEDLNNNYNTEKLSK